MPLGDAPSNTPQGSIPFTRTVREAAPVRTNTPAETDDHAATLAAAIRGLAGSVKPAEVEALSAKVETLGECVDLVAKDVCGLRTLVESIKSSPTQTIRFQIGDMPTGPEIRNARPELAQLAEAVAMGFQNLWLSGPAGSGKTTLAETLAKALGRSFGAQSFAADMTAAQLVGGINAEGKYQETAFVQAYEAGGVYLLDEIDSAPAEILVQVNAALANGRLFLPRHHDPARRIINRHADTVIVAAANTWGTGGTAQYIGRSPIDAATLDRFAGARFYVGYDARLEESILSDSMILARIRKIRENIGRHKIRQIVGTRSVIAAARMVAAGKPTAEILDRLTVGWSDEEKAKALAE
jgi:MoxR-like ATPase